MGLEQILFEISDDAKSEAQNIIDSASREADGITQGFKKEADGLKDKIVTEARLEAEFVFRKEVISKKLNAQKEILQIKRAQLDSCFQEALDVLINLDPALYQNLIKNMLAKIDLKEEAKIIFSSRDRTRLSQDFLSKLNPHFKLSFSHYLKGGFILKSKELIIDNSLENILASLRQDLEPKVAQILFEGT